ncbi:MAG TPA: hypothetical protein VEI97_05145, partial [bacterium]|nr:hypothetical protein [bacterium]
MAEKPLDKAAEWRSQIQDVAGQIDWDEWSRLTEDWQRDRPRRRAQNATEEAKAFKNYAEQRSPGITAKHQAVQDRQNMLWQQMNYRGTQQMRERERAGLPLTGPLKTGPKTALQTLLEQYDTKQFPQVAQYLKEQQAKDEAEGVTRKNGMQYHAGNDTYSILTGQNMWSPINVSKNPELKKRMEDLWNAGGVPQDKYGLMGWIDKNYYNSLIQGTGAAGQAPQGASGGPVNADHTIGGDGMSGAFRNSFNAQQSPQQAPQGGGL